MLSRSFTKAELQNIQFKHIQLLPQIDFMILQNNIFNHVYYSIKLEVLPHQKHDPHPILVEYDPDQFSIRFNDKGNDAIVKPLDSFFSNLLHLFR